MYLKEDYKEMTTRVLVMHKGIEGIVELSRNVEKRRVYKDKRGNRYVRSYGNIYPLNQQNEWRQPVEHVLR